MTRSRILFLLPLHNCTCLCVQEAEYDIVVLFSKRQGAQYVCRTLRSIVHRAHYNNMFLSFTGTRGDDLSAVRASCPEMRTLVTAVFSTSQAAAIDDIVEQLGQSIVNNMNVHVTMNDSPGSEAAAKLIARKVVSQWYAMKNALFDILPNAEVATERHVIVMEDDVVLAEDFDILVRNAIVEAEKRSGVFALSLYDNDSTPGATTRDSMNPQSGASMAPEFVYRGGLRTRRRRAIASSMANMFKSSLSSSLSLLSSPRNDSDIEAFEAFGESLRVRGTPPFLIEGQFGGRQAVLYSGRILDTLRAFFDECDHETRTQLLQLELQEEVLFEEGRSAHSSLSPAASTPCISPIGFFDAYIDMMNDGGDETRLRFFKTKDSLVQHIGLTSGIPGIHEIFHANRALGTVSEVYSIEDSLQIREQSVSHAPIPSSTQQ